MTGNFGDVWRVAPPSMWKTFYKNENHEYKLLADALLKLEFISVLELGCGDGECARTYFPDTHYVGIDLAGNPIKVADAMKETDKHTFICDDYYNHREKRAELVLAMAVLDSCLNVDDTIDIMVNCATKYAFFTTHYADSNNKEHKEDAHSNKLSAYKIRKRYPGIKIRVLHNAKGWLITK